MVAETLPEIQVSTVPATQGGAVFRILDIAKVHLPHKKRDAVLKHHAIRESVSGTDTRTVYLTSAAVAAMHAHIHWGEHAKSNRIEQGGLLLGHAARDERGIYAVAEAAISGEGAEGNSVYLHLDVPIWRHMIEQAGDRYPGLQVIGWYHTHPGSLPVFMSGTDRRTQSGVFSEDWHFALVLNPHRKIWAAFAGTNAEDCCAHWLV